MASLVESVKYGAINTTDTATNEFYVIMFTPEAYILQDNITIDGHIITASELVVKAQYLCSIKVDTNWYWNQHTQQNFITVPTCTIPHPRLGVNAVTDFHTIPKRVCNRTQEKNPYQDIIYVLLILTMITSQKKLVSETKFSLKDMQKFIATTKQIKMSISNEYYMYLLHIYILTVIRYFYLFIFFGVSLMFSIMYMYASYKYYSSIYLNVYSGNLRYESRI